MIRKLQLMHVPSIQEVKPFFVMFHLKLSSEGRGRSLEESLDQMYEPRYLMECFPYLTVELRGISKGVPVVCKIEKFTYVVS